MDNKDLKDKAQQGKKAHVMWIWVIINAYIHQQYGLYHIKKSVESN